METGPKRPGNLSDWTYDEGIEHTMEPHLKTPITGYRVTMARDTETSSDESTLSDNDVVNTILEQLPRPSDNFITPGLFRRRDTLGPASSTLAVQQQRGDDLSHVQPRPHIRPDIPSPSNCNTEEDRIYLPAPDLNNHPQRSPVQPHMSANDMRAADQHQPPNGVHHMSANDMGAPDLQ